MFNRLFFIQFIVIFSFNSLQAQSIGINYFSTGSGKNISSSYSILLNTNEIGFGIGYNINSIKQPDDQSNIYYKRLFSSNYYQHLNLDLFYNKYIFTNLKHLKPFLFYDFQIKYSTTRSSMYIVSDYDSTIVAGSPEEKLLYRKYIEYFGPFLWIDNNVGFGFKVFITDKFYLKQEFGLGVYLVYGDEPKLTKTNLRWGFNDFFNIGIGFRIK